MWTNIVIAALLTWAIAATVFAALVERDMKEWRRLCMNAWIRLDDKQQTQSAARRERDQLIRRLARAEAAMDGLRSIATEAAMLAQLDALRADSAWAPLHDQSDNNQED